MSEPIDVYTAELNRFSGELCARVADLEDDAEAAAVLDRVRETLAALLMIEYECECRVRRG
jgi:hypothetical protein